MGFSGAFRGPFADPFGGAATPWYRAGGAPAPLAAYAPKGAASASASYANLVTPGTYNAAPGVAPTWDAVNGWTFNGSSQYLDSGVPHNDAGQTWSMLVQFSGLVGTSTQVIAGDTASSSAGFCIVPIRSGNVRYVNGGYLAVSPELATGNLCIAGNKGYRNGVADTGSISAGVQTSANIYIGAGNLGLYCACSIQALVIYNSTLTVLQVAAVVAAMAAL